MILLDEEICPDMYRKIFYNICLSSNRNIRLNSCYGPKEDSLASAAFQVTPGYLQVFEDKIQRLKKTLNIRVTDTTTLNKEQGFLDEGWLAFHLEILAKQNTTEENQSAPTVDENTVKRFIQLSKRLNKQLFFKDKNGSMKRVAPSKYDTITAEHLSDIYVNKTGKEEGCLAAIIPQLKQENLIEAIQNIFKEKTYMTNSVNLQEAELVDRPREVGTAYKYPTIPITVRDELKKQGFVQGRYTADWLKEYKGYTIWCKEEHSRKRIAVHIKRGKELLPGGKIAYTEEQLFNIIKEFEEKIDKMRKDPSDRVTVNVDDSFDWNFMTEGMNSLEDQMNADVVKIIDYTKAHLDAFLRHDEGIEEWLNNMSEEGKLDIPAEYCDDYENVRDDEAFEYFKDLLTKTNLAAELDILRDTGDISNYQKIKRAFPKTNNSVTTHADAMSSGKQQMFNLVSSLRSDNGLSNRDILDIVQSVLEEGN